MSLLELITLGISPICFNSLFKVDLKLKGDIFYGSIIYALFMTLIMSLLVMYKCTSLYVIDHMLGDVLKALYRSFLVYFGVKLSLKTVFSGADYTLLQILDIYFLVILNYIIFMSLWT